MSVLKNIKKRAQRRALRTRKSLKRHSVLPRVSVFRSANHIYAQIIDDAAQTTVASCSSVDLKNTKGDKKAVAHAVGLELASRAKKKGIETAVFDRGSFLYHGRVKSLADGLREGGLSI
ncbi:MAG TPA: 50S ribosomal protein L18 [Candidatus Babeliales bacterium]|nr:50S ribosomal protein L18 [Candidatus Babeliales bacterium]